jgi:hypothetical protein
MSEEQSAAPAVDTSVTTLDTSTGELVTAPAVEQTQPAVGTSDQNSAANGARTQESNEVDEHGEPVRGKNWHARKIDEANRRAAHAERERAQLLELVQRMAPPAKVEPPKPEVPPSEYAGHPGFDPNDPEPSRDDPRWRDYEHYLGAVAQWNARLEGRGMDRTREYRQQETVRQQQVVRHVTAVANNFAEKLEVFERSNPDYSEVVDNLDFEAPLPMARAIITSDDPARIFHALGRAPDEARRIAKLSPDAQIRAIGRLEAHLDSATPVSNAPAPGNPTGSTRAVARGGYRDDFSVEEHIAWRKANPGK